MNPVPIAPAAHAIPTPSITARSGRATPLQPADYMLAVHAANDLRDRIAESDRTLAEHDAALDLEHLSRVRLRAVLVGIAADEARPVIAGNVAFWLGADGQVTSRPIPPEGNPAGDHHAF